MVLREGDCVSVKFDPVESTLTFSRGGESGWMKIDPIILNKGPVCFCVRMYQGSDISIVWSAHSNAKFLTIASSHFDCFTRLLWSLPIAHQKHRRTSNWSISRLQTLPFSCQSLSAVRRTCHSLVAPAGWGLLPQILHELNGFWWLLLLALLAA